MTHRKPPAIFLTVRQVALVQLLITAEEAQHYLDKGADRAAIGKLITLDELVTDLNAALRVYHRKQRSDSTARA